MIIDGIYYKIFICRNKAQSETEEEEEESPLLPRGDWRRDASRNGKLTARSESLICPVARRRKLHSVLNSFRASFQIVLTSRTNCVSAEL